MKLLYIAWATPYDSVCHGGGQTFNYYIKGIAKDRDVEVTLVSVCMEDELSSVDTQEYGITNRLVVKHKSIQDSLRNIVSINSKVNPCHKYCNLFSTKTAMMVLKEVRKLEAEGYQPDTVVLEWTESLLLIREVKQIFPDAKYVASEHDVTFLRIQREANTNPDVYKKLQADNIFKRECAALRLCDKIIVHNDKDRRLLESVGIAKDKLFTIVPFFHKSQLEYKRENSDILFFGNMTRPENIEAADWFKEKIMPDIAELGCRFIVLGKGAQYIERIDEPFSKSMCFVCPLIHGAGIKIKVLEAMYSGIPVLTNDIGIEGIPAETGIDYYHCDAPDDYIRNIKSIFSGEHSISGKSAIEQNFNMEESLEKYIHMIKSI